MSPAGLEQYGINYSEHVSILEAAERRASAAGRQLHQAQVVDERHADSGPLQALVRRVAIVITQL